VTTRWEAARKNRRERRAAPPPPPPSPPSLITSSPITVGRESSASIAKDFEAVRNGPDERFSPGPKVHRLTQVLIVRLPPQIALRANHRWPKAGWPARTAIGPTAGGWPRRMCFGPPRTGLRPWGECLVLFFFDRFLCTGQDLFGNLRRHVVIVIHLHAIAAFALSHRRQLRAIRQHLGHWHFGIDHCRTTF